MDAANYQFSAQTGRLLCERRVTRPWLADVFRRHPEHAEIKDSITRARAPVTLERFWNSWLQQVYSWNFRGISDLCLEPVPHLLQELAHRLRILSL